MGRYNNVNLPPQKLSYEKKGTKWRKSNLDYADNYSFYNNETVRQTLQNKIINLNLYNGIVNINDMTETINPYGLEADFIQHNPIPHHPIMVPKIDLLVGEETKRRFDWNVVVTNQNAISSKEESKKKFLLQKITSFLEQDYEEKELEAKMAELEKFMKYNWQDVREKMANQILRHYWEEQEFEYKFIKGFKNAFLFAEEIYQTDIEFGEPVLRHLNPLKVHAVRSGNSDRIEDSSIIIIEDHWAPAKIIDLFHEELKSKDIDSIMEYSNVTGNGGFTDDDNNHVLLRDGQSEGDSLNTLLDYVEVNGHQFGRNYIDNNGNIRVLRVYWKSLKQLKKIKFYDEAGESQFKFVSEEYIIDENLGEEETNMWVNEWWEGTKIGRDIYLQMKPRSVQYNNLNNPSYCHPGIIGQVYNTNQGRAVSLVDRIKNYQYLYDAVWDRLNKAIATNYGKIFELDLAKVPENWEIEKWLHFAVVIKIAVVDSFKEGNKGAATGKLAGGMNTVGGRSIDMETGGYIQQQINVLEFIKMEMGEIAGVSRQREGQVQNRETKGGIERSVVQSSHITEYWFMQHEKLKLRVLAAFLETAKVALKGKNKKVQYILDDQTIQMLNIDGNEFNESNYGLVVSSSSKTMELEQALKEYAHAMLQNGGRLSTVMDIYFSSSLSDMRRKLEIAEERIEAQASKSAEDTAKLQKEELDKKYQLEVEKLKLEKENNIRDNDTKLAVEELKQEAVVGEEDKDMPTDEHDELGEAKLDLDTSKAQNDLIVKMKQLSNDMTKHRDNLEIKKKELVIKNKKPANK